MKTGKNSLQQLAITISCVTLLCATQALSQENEERRVSAIYYAPGFPDIMGFAQLESSAEDAIAKASQQCEEKSGGDCYQGLVYDKCGAVSEMQMGNPEGNPKGWAPAETLQQALDLSMRQCNYYARSIALNRYESDEELLSKAKTSPCAVVYYHCTAWGPVELERQFGVPEDPTENPLTVTATE